MFGVETAIYFDFITFFRYNTIVNKTDAIKVGLFTINGRRVLHGGRNGSNSSSRGTGQFICG